jgi:3-phenylpropionate/cinnamic acid dioxygenase small subunit
MTEADALLAVGQNVLAREAVFLDERRWDEWLALFTPDCEYWIPSWRNEDSLTDNPQAEVSHIYYASRTGLEDRVARVRSGKSPASNPLRRTTHMIGNVLLLDSRAGESMKLRSSWTCHFYDPHRQRTDLIHGHSTYELRSETPGWLIAKRKSVLQNDTLPSMLDFYCL